MSLVFNTPKSALNTTSKEIQNLATDCPPCPECPEVQLETADVEYTSNGEYTITPEGDGFSSVDVTVNVDVTTPYNEGYAAGETAGIATGKTQGAAEQKAKLTSLNVTENGSYNREDGYNAVTVNVQPDLQAKTVTPTTSQQVVSPDQGKDGLSQVTVSGVTSTIDSNIQAGNIKDGVTILGVTGSYAGASCPDWSSIGWDCNDVNAATLADNVAHTAQKKAAFEAGTICNFMNDRTMVFAPKVLVYDGASLFYNCRYLQFVPNLEFKSRDLFPNCYSNAMFFGCESLKQVSLDLKDSRAEDTFVKNSSGGGPNAMFQDCSSLQNVTLVNTNGWTNTVSLFQNCTSLQNAPSFYTGNCVIFNNMFYGCRNLTTVPQYDTSNATSLAYMFGMSYSYQNNTKLTSLPLFDATKVTNIDGFTKYCTAITTLGGLTNLGKAFTGANANQHTLDLSYSTVLTKESIMNVINNLAAPDDTTVTDATLKLSAASYALLSAEDIAIATAKNWSVVSA